MSRRGPRFNEEQKLAMVEILSFSFCAMQFVVRFTYALALSSLSMFFGLLWPTLDAKGIFRDRDKFRHVGRGRLARHIVTMEKFRRISFVRPLLLAHRAHFYCASPLSSN